ANFRGSITLEITPPSFDNIEPYIESYLTVLRYLDYPLYLKKRMRLFALRPLIQRFQSNDLQRSG
ncbi:MAG: hypothetical protein ONB12_07370, partial [candidate division KSB1 bacterium]|nr:hypothetical protein [candidate division KSB1 bacterium]